MKLTFTERFNILIGKPYLLNKNTGEVHDLRNKKPSCFTFMMNKKNKQYISKKHFKQIFNKEKYGVLINGCKHCNSNFDLG